MHLHLCIYISLKSQNHTESSILIIKKKVYPLHCQKYICVFFVIIVDWMIIFDKGSIEYLEINSMSPGGCSFNFMCVMFKCVVVITFLSISNTMYCLYVNGSTSWQMSVRIGLGYGLVLSGNKPLPEPMLTEIYVAIRCHLATMS